MYVTSNARSLTPWLRGPRRYSRMASRPWMAWWCGGRYTASGAYAATTLSKIPAFQCRAQSSPVWRMMTAALLVLADLRAVRTGLRGALFARFFTVVFIVGPPTKELLRTYFTAEGILVCLASKFTGSSLLGIHNLFDRSHCSVDEEAIRGKWGIDSCKP